MILSCLGHSKFLIELACGMRIVTDPFDRETGYPVRPVKADAVLVSHHHHDHDAVDTVDGHPQVIDGAGVHTLAKGVTVTGIPSFHDDAQGAKRGPNVMFLLEAEGLRVAHLGDLGHLPGKDAVKLLDPVDVLMLPVGGHFTIGVREALETARLLHARVILPMHYRTRVTASWPIAPVDDFLALCGGAVEAPLLRVTKEDLTCQPHVAVLRAQD